jgi:hypothetical protein
MAFAPRWTARPSIGAAVAAGAITSRSPKSAALKHDDLALAVPHPVVMLREGGASSNYGERSCLLDRPLARAMTVRD